MSHEDVRCRYDLKELSTEKFQVQVYSFWSEKNIRRSPGICNFSFSVIQSEQTFLAALWPTCIPIQRDENREIVEIPIRFDAFLIWRRHLLMRETLFFEIVSGCSSHCQRAKRRKNFLFPVQACPRNLDVRIWVVDFAQHILFRSETKRKFFFSLSLFLHDQTLKSER